MSDRTITERLQPSLLDRLTDSDPGVPAERRDDRVIDLRRLREIRWLPADSDVETVLAAFESPPESGRQHATG